MTQQWKRTVESWLTYLFLPLLAVAILSISIVFAQAVMSTNKAVDQLHRNAITSCGKLNEARKDSNAHIRRPLKATAGELATILEQAARQLPDGQRRKKTETLAEQFQSYADQVHEVKLFPCATLNKGP